MKASDEELLRLREQAEAAIARPVIRFVDLDPRLALRIVNELQTYRATKVIEQ